jgi:hypothetical protein
MSSKKVLFAAACAGFLALTFMPGMKADEWDKRTKVTINEPIIAGNKVLQPGTYIWKLMDSASNRHIVQIFNADQSQLETTVLAIPDYRLKPADKTQFAFYETPAGVPKAVHAWFYPGDNYGQAFAFPKKLVAQLASARPVPVPENYAPPVSQNEQVETPAPAAAPAPEPAQEVAQNTTPEPPPAVTTQDNTTPVQQTTPAPAARVLPKTASYAPLVGLIGLFSMSLFGVLSLAMKRF